MVNRFPTKAGIIISGTSRENKSMNPDRVRKLHLPAVVSFYILIHNPPNTLDSHFICTPCMHEGTCTYLRARMSEPNNIFIAVFAWFIMCTHSFAHVLRCVLYFINSIKYREDPFFCRKFKNFTVRIEGYFYQRN